MRPSSEARFGVAMLLALQLTTSASGVALLGRMSPAVDRILKENVYSTEAVEEMLATLARSGGDPTGFRAALARAQGNVTEPDEVAILAAIEGEMEEALAGGPARDRAVENLVALGSINRASMRRADDWAQSLGLAGAWAMTLLGFASFLASLVVFRRIEHRLLRPILEVDQVLDSARSGDAIRRCSLDSRSAEGGRLMANLNWLLDHRTGPPLDADREDRVASGLLLAVLDSRKDRVMLAGDADGRVVALNRLALERAGPTAWGVTSRAIARGEVPDGWTVIAAESGAWVGDGPSSSTPITAR